MYYIPDPPYLLLVAGLLVALTSGAAFSGTLKQIVQKWSDARTGDAIAKLPTGQLVIPFLGISAGVCIFLCSGLEIFGFPAMLSYTVGVPLTVGTGLLVWFQLNSMLALAEKEGSQAFNIDSW
jgi:TRAP-type C4-dicarboxylate transport system permease small subunit